MFTVTYHPGVRKDFRAMDRQHADILHAAIETKLTQKPEVYGKPLRQTLKNLRTLRMGDYRIVYAIRNQKLLVLVLIVGKRDGVYEAALQRLRGMG